MLEMLFIFFKSILLLGLEQPLRIKFSEVSTEDQILKITQLVSDSQKKKQQIFTCTHWESNTTNNVDQI